MSRKHGVLSRSSSYLKVVGEKMEKYSILSENMYNVDGERGFLIGKLQKAQSVFTKDLHKLGKLAAAGQDGNREWITVVAAICADGSSLSQALIYRATSGNLQDTYLDILGKIRRGTSS